MGEVPRSGTEWEMVNEKLLSESQFISPEVRAARITNYRNFSPAMAASADVSPLTVEYFCFPGDDLWAMSEAELVKLATDEQPGGI